MRVDQELRDLIEAAVAASERETLSEWARDALEAGARAELAEHLRLVNAPPAAKGSLGFAGGGIQPSGCQHPPQARWVGVAEISCMLCGQTVRRTL